MTFNHCYQDKTVLVTGHTGFKGSWLIAWLKMLGANVVGVALEPITEPSLFKSAILESSIVDYRIDVRDQAQLEKIVMNHQPDFVFHLAAQALVKDSYIDPLKTWSTNVMGTVNILESLRKLTKICAAVLITSDKCYENVEWIWGYRENDRVGGMDPYSASKGAAEIAISSYMRSFFYDHSPVKICSVRAGNVIGGGDWSPDRIIPDCVKAWSQNEVVTLRNPSSTRPWQHVLEPLSGYLWLGAQMSERIDLTGESFNFGPLAQQNHSVLELVKEMAHYWSSVRWMIASENQAGAYESNLLKLNCDKALALLNWHAVMPFEETVKLTAQWYRNFYKKERPIIDFTNAQIDYYCTQAKNQGLAWA